jgi:hypothetical protein
MNDKPTYDELFELLDNVSAIAYNIFGQFSKQMGAADRTNRGNVIRMTRIICDKYLRGG